MYKTINTAIVVLLLVLSTTSARCKEREGVYQLYGTMYDTLTKLPLSNAMFIINKDTIYTDAKGQYSYLVHWSAFEKPRFFCQKKKYKEAEELANPKYIELGYKSESKKIDNRWREYGLQKETRAERKFKVDFYWSNDKN